MTERKDIAKSLMCFAINVELNVVLIEDKSSMTESKLNYPAISSQYR